MKTENNQYRTYGLGAIILLVFGTVDLRAAPNENSALGLNIGGVTYWSSEIVFVDRHPRMKALYLDYLAGWKANGGTLAAIFSSMGAYSKWGSWGLLEYHGQRPWI